MKTQYNINILMLFIIALMVSCSDFLEEVPESQISTVNYYRNRDEARVAVNSVYQSLKSSAITGWETKTITTDIKRAADYNKREGFADYTLSPNNSIVFNIWKNHYQGINRANTVIDNVVEKEEIDGWEDVVGEAKFLRAYYYFNLVRYFGAVPLVLNQTTSLNQVDIEVTRNSVEEVYASIISDLEFAVENCLLKGEVEYGRITKDAASALLAKVYLTIGSTTKRDGLGDGNEYFKKSYEASKRVIDGGRYSLVPFYPDVFIRDNKGNEELLFMVQYQAGEELGSWVGCHMGIGDNWDYGGSWNTVYATDYFATMFEKSDSIRRFWNVEKAKIGVEDGKGVFLSYETPKYYPNNYSGGNLPGWPPFSIGKFRRFPIRDANYVFQGWDLYEPLLRYADVLLMYAEALNEYHGGPDGEAYNAVNQVRARARNVNLAGDIQSDILPRIIETINENVPDLIGLDYQMFKEEVLNERAKELVGEITNRWFDLVRHGLLVEKIKALKSYQNPITGKVESSWYAADNVKEYHQLLPIPKPEMDANPKLTQNIGY